MRSDGLEVMFTAESHMTAKAESGQLVRLGRLPLNDSGGGAICFDGRRGLQQHLEMFNVSVPSVCGKRKKN